MNNVKTFAASALVDLAEGKSKIAYIARMVLTQNHPHVGNQLAMTFVQLSNNRRIASAAGMPVHAKPELMLNFMQQLMNKVCWNARKLKIAQDRQMMEETARGESTSVDFSQDIADQLDVPPMTDDAIFDAVHDDFKLLTNVQTWLASKMLYLENVEPFYVYADSAPDEETGEWQLRKTADNFAEALHIMDELLDELNAAEEQKTGTEARDIDFTKGFGSEEVTKPQLNSREHREIGGFFKPQEAAAH